MTRIVHMIPHDGIGGVEESARYLARTLPADEYRLLAIAGSTIETFPGFSSTGHRRPLSPLAWLAAARQVRRLSPQILVFSLWKSVPAAFLAVLMGVRAKMVFTLNSHRAAHLAERVASWAALWLADEVWADSKRTLAGRAPNHPGGRVVDPFLPMPTSDWPHPAVGARFVVWARLDRAKGLDRAIAIIARLAELGDNPHFRIFGPDCGEGDALRSLADARKVSDRIEFCGPSNRDGLADEARHATFFLMPSRIEGMALATVEAMQLGLIPIVTPVGEMADYVTDGINGLLIDGDDADGSARRIADLLRDPKALASMSKAARRTWERTPDFAHNIRVAADDLLGTAAKPDMSVGSRHD